MNYWMLMVMMLVAVLVVTAVLADDEIPPVRASPANSDEGEDSIEHGDF